MKSFKYVAATTLLAGVLALPLAGANAETHSNINKSSGSSSSAQIGQQSFSAYDADQSGTLNEAEYGQLGTSVDFKTADANGDGAITLAELNAAHTSSGKVSSRMND